MDRGFVVAAGLMVVLATATGCASGRATWTRGAVAVADAAESPRVMHSDSPAAAMAPLEFHAFDLGFTPQTLAVPAPGTYHVVFVNDGAIFHDMTFDDGTVISADPGGHGEADVVIPASGIGFICSI